MPKNADTLLVKLQTEREAMTAYFHSQKHFVWNEVKGQTVEISWEERLKKLADDNATLYTSLITEVAPPTSVLDCKQVAQLDTLLRQLNDIEKENHQLQKKIASYEKSLLKTQQEFEKQKSHWTEVENDLLNAEIKLMQETVHNVKTQATLDFSIIEDAIEKSQATYEGQRFSLYLSTWIKHSKNLHHKIEEMQSIVDRIVKHHAPLHTGANDSPEALAQLVSLQQTFQLLNGSLDSAKQSVAAMPSQLRLEEHEKVVHEALEHEALEAVGRLKL